MLQSAIVPWMLGSCTFPSSLLVSALAFLVPATLVLIFLLFNPINAVRHGLKKGTILPPELDQSAGEIVKGYFGNQFDFLRNGFSVTASSVFQFKLNRHRVIALSGEEGRNAFLREKGLNLYEGFQVIIGTIPSGLDPHQLGRIYKRIGHLQRPENLQNLIPWMLSDCKRKMASWGSHGQLDLCSAIHGVTFQMVIRAVISFEVAEDFALVSRLKHYYDTIDSSFKPFLTMLPWIPGPSTILKIWASIKIYHILKRAIRDRKTSGEQRKDALQQLLDAGESETCVTGFMMGLPIAGARSTGTIGTWLMIFLSSNPDWATAVRNELRDLLTTHNPSTSTSNSTETLVEDLSNIPLTAWESKTPCLDLCIRETLRCAQPHTAVRKNIGPEFTVGPYTIPSGAFVAYPFADTFLNPKYYPDPTRWNPARAIPSEELYLGWGGGKHMCRGQRLASLTMKLVAAYALMRFDLTMVDGQGVEMQGSPEPDWNDFLTCRPKEACSIAFKKQSTWSTAPRDSSTSPEMDSCEE